MKKLGLLIAGVLLSTNALADVILCNDDPKNNFDSLRYTYGAFVNQNNQNVLITQGWFNLKPNTCHSILFGDNKQSNVNTVFLRAFGVKGNNVTPLTNVNSKDYKLCTSLNNSFRFTNGENSIQCTVNGGEMLPHDVVMFDRNSKHDVIRITASEAN